MEDQYGGRCCKYTCRTIARQLLSFYIKNTAAWKIIKTWLPEKFVDRVKFQDKKTLKDYIDLDNQLAEWGGTDNYVFKFEPAKKSRRNVNNNSMNVNGMETKAKNNKVRRHFSCIVCTLKCVSLKLGCQPRDLFA